MAPFALPAAGPFVRKLLHRLGFSCAPNPISGVDANYFALAVWHSVGSCHFWSGVATQMSRFYPVWPPLAPTGRLAGHDRPCASKSKPTSRAPCARPRRSGRSGSRSAPMGPLTSFSKQKSNPPPSPTGAVTSRSDRSGFGTSRRRKSSSNASPPFALRSASGHPAWPQSLVLPPQSQRAPRPLARSLWLG
jgi:hypothetical protein